MLEVGMYAFLLPLNRRLETQGRLFSAFLAIFFFSACCNVGATQLRIVTEHLPPFNYQSTGKVTGYATEILQAVLKEAKIDAPIEFLPWERAYQETLAKPNTLIYSTARIPDREKLFEWIGPIGPRQVVLFKLRERKDIQIKTLADAAPYKIGVVRALASTRMLMKTNIIPLSRFDEAPTTESNLRKLLLKRVDLIVGLKGGTYYELTQLLHQGTEIEYILTINDEHPLYFALNKESDPALVNKLRRAFDKIHTREFITNLKKKYHVE
jgi:polar amino acid transport system substrate-binding protein